MTPFGQSTFWRGTESNDAEAGAGIRQKKGGLRDVLWAKVRRLAGRLPFVEDLLAAYYCAFDQVTPLQVKVALLGAIAYFVLPFDVVPDFLPLLGFSDDAAVLATALAMVGSHVRPEHRDAARASLVRGLDQTP